MKTKQIFLRFSFLTLLVAVIVTSSSRGFTVPSPGLTLCELMRNAPFREVTSDTKLVFEEPGTIAAYHGFGCAITERGGALRVEQSLELPSYATNATVFLNGWRVRYLSKDHHVAGLGTLIDNIRLERTTLKWQAGGVFGDKGFDDGYDWCYNYTVVAWNPSKLNLKVDHDGCDVSNDTQANYFFARNNFITLTALSSFPSFLHNPDFASSKNVAILPRGFGFAFDGGDDEHHLQQIGYNLDHSENFIENGKGYSKRSRIMTLFLPNSASRVSKDYVSWETSVIFKDNKIKRDYDFGEMVSAIGGNDVGVIQPPFSILPASTNPYCSNEKLSPSSEEFVVENVPFEFAIPMLTGWELHYRCEDEHVTGVGIWIDTWSYDKTTRTLRYQLHSTLHDKSVKPQRYHRDHKVTILGLRPVTGVVTPLEKSPDLVTFSPFGNTADKFCRVEQNGQLLRVTVKNQGNEQAGASKTTVTFVNASITLNTPAIPAGGSTDLLFRIPLNCFSPDCSFRITVDSDNQVNESNNEGNNSTVGNCIG